MYEKVNPSHPDKVADRIAGALVDYAYAKEENPRIAVEVLIGHGECNIIAETSVEIPLEFVSNTVHRIAKSKVSVRYKEVPQDPHLAENQSQEIRCGDNGIFKGVPVTEEQRNLTSIVKQFYKQYPYDGKFVLCEKGIVICQSHCGVLDNTSILIKNIENLGIKNIAINPLGYWTGGINVDSGATNRKLGSDMGDSVTGGGLMGKDLSKADVSVNIYVWLKAQIEQKPVELCCAIGDNMIDGKPYKDIVEIARSYIKFIGGFERFAEWGLIR